MKGRGGFLSAQQAKHGITSIFFLVRVPNVLYYTISYSLASNLLPVNKKMKQNLFIYTLE